MKRAKLRTAIALVATLAIGGCTTAMQSACLRGEGFNGMSAESTCQGAAIQTEQQNQALMIGMGVLVAGAVGFSAYEATRPTYVYSYPQTVTVNRGLGW